MVQLKIPYSLIIRTETVISYEMLIRLEATGPAWSFISCKWTASKPILLFWPSCFSPRRSRSRVLTTVTQVLAEHPVILPWDIMVLLEAVMWPFLICPPPSPRNRAILPEALEKHFFFSPASLVQVRHRTFCFDAPFRVQLQTSVEVCKTAWSQFIGGLSMTCMLSAIWFLWSSVILWD